jgi:hypothetical protein
MSDEKLHGEFQAANDSDFTGRGVNAKTTSYANSEQRLRNTK